MQATLHHSTLEALAQFREVLDTARKEDREKGEALIKTDTHLMFVCRLTGPSILRLARPAGKLLAEYLVDIFSMMADVERLFDDVVGRSSSGIESVIDFLYFLRSETQMDAVLKQHKPTIEFIKSKPQLRFFLEQS